MRRILLFRQSPVILSKGLECYPNERIFRGASERLCLPSLLCEVSVLPHDAMLRPP